MDISGTGAKQIISEKNESTHVVNTNIESVRTKATPTPPNVCRFVKIDAFDPKVMKMVKYYPQISCKGYHLSLVFVDDSILRVNLTKVKTNSKAKDFSYCRYRPIFKNETSDYHAWFGGWSEKFNDTIKLSDRDEYIMAECYDKTGKGISRSYSARAVWDEEKDKAAYSTGYAQHLMRFSPKEKFNVMMVGLDGMARTNFERMMPKTRNFILNEMAAIELEKFNKVGWSTIINLIPLFSGITYKNLHKYWKDSEPFDKVNHLFVWSDYKKAGYRTALDLEEAKISGFHCKRYGFHKPPVHMYTRPLSIGVDGDAVMNGHDPLCKGDQPGITLHNDFFLRLAARFNQSLTPYFSVSFRTKLTHDDLNMASAGDDVYLEFFQQLKKRNVLHNTIFFLFSDHGEVYGPIRRTYNGVIESKTPMSYVIVPPWFKSKYPDVFNTLTTNAKGLTSTMDLHATLKDIIYFKSSSKPADLYTGPGTSLFQPIPKTRQCVDAGIPTTFCNCNSLTSQHVPDKDKQFIGSTVVSAINTLLAHEQDCDALSLQSVLSIMVIEHLKDIHGSVINRASFLYQISVMTTPGQAVFEAVVEWNKSTKQAKTLGAIGRINMYRGQKDCVKEPDLRVYCYCT